MAPGRAKEKMKILVILENWMTILTFFYRVTASIGYRIAATVG
jgi:hypothetical protein